MRQHGAENPEDFLESAEVAKRKNALPGLFQWRKEAQNIFIFHAILILLS